jgi:hypothetical protein
VRFIAVKDQDSIRSRPRRRIVLIKVLKIFKAKTVI